MERMRTGSMPLPAEQAARAETREKAIHMLLRFALSFLIAKAGLYQTALPFGVSLAAALPPGIPGAAGLAGVIFGYALAPGDFAGLRYIACAAAAAAMRKIADNLRLSERLPWLLPVTAGSVCAATGCADLIQRGADMLTALFVLCESLLAGGFVVLLSVAESAFVTGRGLRRADLKQKSAAGFVGFAVLMGLAGISLFGVSPGRAAAMLASLLAGALLGPLAGCAVGGAGAAACLLPDPARLWFLAAALPAAGMLAGLLRSRFGAAFSALAAAGGITALCAGTLAAPLMLEQTAAALFFLFAPDRWFASREKRGGREEAPPASPQEPESPLRRPGAGRRQHSLPPVPERPAGLLERLEQVSDALRAIAGRMEQPAQQVSGADMAAVYQAAVGSACRRCGLSRYCFEDGGGALMAALRETAPVLAERGSIRAEELPDALRGKCVRAAELAGTISAEYGKYRSLRGRESRESAQMALLRAQYRNLSQMMEGIADAWKGEATFDVDLENAIEQALARRGLRTEEVTAVTGSSGALCVEILLPRLCGGADPQTVVRVCEECAASTRAAACGEPVRFFEPEAVSRAEGTMLTLRQRPSLRASVSRAASTKSGESCSGDADTVFDAPDGRKVIVISDGMGSGTEAQSESRFAVDTFAQLTKSGVTRECALRMLNTALIVRDSDCFATCDVCALNLYNGEAEFIKAGAAPSFILRAGRVYRIESSTLPGGILEGAELERSRCVLEAGDILVIVSDGVVACGEDSAWLDRLLCDYTGAGGQPLAEQILRESRARREPGRDDDMTCYAIRMEPVSVREPAAVK